MNTETDSVRGQGGEQMAEEAMDANGNMAWQHTNVWAGGTLIGTYDNNGLHFYLNDWLGTRRVQTDYEGVTEQTCSSLPYGNGETCTTPFPTENLFTGKERDTESGNDYFGARYYANSMGRFLSPDPSKLYYADPTNPQSLNLYSYALNNPLKNIDPTGLYCYYGDTDSESPDWNDASQYDYNSSTGECGDTGGTWIDDQPVETLQMESDHPGEEGSDPSEESSVAGEICSTLPSGSVEGIGGGMGFLGATTGALEVVTNYRTGQVSGFAAGGLSAGWNNGVASAAVYSGAVWGLNNDNSNYSGGFTSGTVSVSTPIPFAGVQATGSSSSGGLTGARQQMIPNPTAPNAVDSLTFGVNAALRSPPIAVTAAVTNYSKSLQLGRYIPTSLPDGLGFVANQVCSALGY